MLKERLAKASQPRLDFTLLTEDQIWGDKNGNGQLDAMKRYGTAVAPTDLAILMGCRMGQSAQKNIENNLTARAWTASPENEIAIRIIMPDGNKWYSSPFGNDNVVRPALSPSKADQSRLSRQGNTVNGVEIVEYGEYPQTVVNQEVSHKLENAFIEKKLRLTGKQYSLLSTNPFEQFPSKPKDNPEYEYNGKKYIRIEGAPYSNHSYLSDGQQAQEGETYWVEVQPIEWLMDKSGTLVSKKGLFTGVPFDSQKGYAGDFSKTSIKRYLDTYFAKEIEPSENTTDREQTKMLADLKKQLTEVSDFEKVKKSVKPAKTPERTNELVEITRLRRASALLKPIAQKAAREKDYETLNAIMEIAQQFEKPWMKMQEKVAQKAAARRAKNGRG